MGGGNGIASIVWGPVVWNTLHLIASAFPDRPTEIEKKQYFAFVLNLGPVLPCQVCKSHYKQTLTDLGFCLRHVENQETFFRFIFDLHNHVNQRLGKPLMDYEYIRAKYDAIKQL